MRQLTLAKSASITLDASGGGTAELGPALPGETWSPDSVNISMTGNTPSGVATCFIYAGSGISPATFIDSTYNVLGAASSVISGKTLYPGQAVYAVFTGGNPGATATVAVNGTRTAP